MPTPIASLRLNARGLAAAGALAFSACALAAAAGPAWASSPQWNDSFHFVLLSAGDGSSSINGNSEDYSRAQSLRAGNGPLFYFREAGAAYVVRDGDMLRRAEAVLEPQRVLGRQQSALGRQQSELGKQQGALGREQGRIGALQANGTIRQIEEMGRQMAELGHQQAALGAQQAALGRQQSALGSRQEQASRVAEGQLRALAAEALRRGLAQRVN